MNFFGRDAVERYEKALVVRFGGRRRVLSSGPLGGGCREDLEAVFNLDMTVNAQQDCPLRADTYEEHMAVVAREDLGLQPHRVSGLGTAASMDNAAVARTDGGGFAVTVLATAGIDVNGGRAGDPASWEEKPGTINLILAVDAVLPPGTLVQALITATEAKTAVLQELMAPSLYSQGLATGSGTDGVILISNLEADRKRTDAGKHSLLGEAVGKAVKEAVREALFLETGMCTKRQRRVLRRVSRFGITADSLWQRYSAQGAVSREEFLRKLERMEIDPKRTLPTALYVHLLDQLLWGLETAEEAAEEAARLAEQLSGRYPSRPARDLKGLIMQLEQSLALSLNREAQRTRAK